MDQLIAKQKGSKGQRRFDAVAAAMIFVAVFAVFSPSLFGDFVCDDWPQVVRNEGIRSLANVPSFFTRGVWASTSVQLRDYYRPVFLTALALNYKLWGPHPFGYHLSSLLLHAIVSTLVYFLLKRLISRADFALLGALLFALHPVHTESVSWISGMTDLLAALFALLAFLAYIRHAEGGRPGHLALSAGMFLLAAMSKETALALVAVIFAYDYHRNAKIPWGRISVLVAICALYLAAMHFVLGREGAAGAMSFSSFRSGRLMEFIAGYIRLLFVPWPQSVYLILPRHPLISTWGFVFSGLAISAVIMLSVRDRLIRFSFLWVIITLLPALALILSANPLFASRYLYLPSVGFAILLAVLLGRLGSFRRAAAVAAGIAVLYSALSVQATANWKNDSVFYRMTLRDNPANYNAYSAMAEYYQRHGQTGDAIRAYMDSLSHVSDKDKELAYGNLALIYGKLGNTEQSTSYFRKMLELNPTSSDAFKGLGNNYLIKRDYKSAVDNYEKSLALDSGNLETAYNLATAYESMGNTEMAAEYYRKFLSGASESRYAVAVARARGFLQKHGHQP